MPLDLSDAADFEFNERPVAKKNRAKGALDLSDADAFEWKPYSRRGSIEARNKQAEPDILGRRAQRFQLINELDAETPFYMGGTEAALSAMAKQKELEDSYVDRSAGFDPKAYDAFMDAESGGMSAPGAGAAAQAAMQLDPAAVGATFREGWRTTKAGSALAEYDATGRVTISDGTVSGIPVGEPQYLTGSAAEKYIRDLASATDDTAIVAAFNKRAGVGAQGLVGALAQPESALSILGGVAGMAVGAPTIGAAVGSIPSVLKGGYSDYLTNRQAEIDPPLAAANAIGGAGIDMLTETIGGRFGAGGGVLRAGGISAVEESASEAGRIGLTAASTYADPRFQSLLPGSFAEGAEQVGVAGVAGGIAGAALRGATVLPGKVAEGLAKAREALTKAGGVSAGRPTSDSTKPSNKDAPVSKDQDYSTQSTTDTSLVKPISIPVKPADDLASREILPTGDTTTTAPLSPVQLTPADAGTIIDTRLSALREASQQNRLDDGTVKALQREDEELRLTLQEDESRKQQGILQTPERPYLSDNARGLISQKRAEIRERLEQHRAAVGYGNELRDLETRLGKLGESDTDVIALADSLVRGQGASVSRAAAQMASVSTQKQSQTIPATTPQAAVTEAPVAPTASVPASTVDTTVGTPATEEQNLVTSTQVTSVSNTKPKKAPAPKVLSDKDAMVQATVELQSRAASDPEYQAFATKNPAAFGKQIRERANQLLTQSKQQSPTTEVTTNGVQKGQEDGIVGTGQGPEVKLDVATATTKETYPDKDAFYSDLFSGVMDKEATEAKKVQDNIVVYNGDADLRAIDPAIADKVEEAVQKQGDTGARPRAFQYNGKVYFNLQGLPKGSAKSTFLHEARVHLAAETEPARVSSLAGRVVALAKSGDPTAKAAAATVSKEYPGLAKRSKEGDPRARDMSREELLADFAQRVYDRVKAGQGVSGTIKRLYTDVMSYLRDRYTTIAKKYLGERFALSITDVDILDAVRYGRTAAGFKGEATPTPSAQAEQAAVDSPQFSMDRETITPDTGVEMPKYDKATSAVMRVADTAAGLLTPRGIATKDAQRMGERAVGVSNALRLEGEVLTVNLNKALDDVTEGMNIRQKAVYRYNVGAYLAGDPTVTDLPKSVKDAADAMREMLDNNTLRLIAVGAVAPKDIPKMLNNLGRWVHRDYEVFHYTPGTIGDPGGYFRKVQEMASQGYDVVAEVLPDVMDTIRLPTSDVIHKLGDMAGMKVTKGAKEKKQEYGKLLRQVQGKQEPKKPKNEKVKALREGAEQYLRDMAAKWGIGRTLPLDGDNGIVARLAALSDGGVEDLRAAAKRYANSLLDPDAAPFDDAPFKRNTGNNLSIDDSALDEARKDLPAWQRKLWGQFKDPATMFLVSLENQANIIAKFTALAEYKQRGLKSGNVKQNVAGMNAANMHPKGYYLLENKEDPLYYGPMQGMWVKQRDYAYLQLAATQSLQEKAIRESMGKWGLQVLTVPGQVAKMTIIGLDHTSQIMQYLSSVFMMSGSLTSPGTIKAASKGAAYTAFAGTKFGKAIADDTLSDDVKAWISQGVLINNALAGDARRKLRELAAQPGEIFLPPIVRVGKKVARGYRGTLDAASRILSFGDETSKIMMLYARMEHLSKIHPEMSREELRELAGEQTLATTPSYNREAPLAKIMGNSGYFNAFATFWAAQIRNTANHLAIAAKYSTMPGMAAKRYATMELGHLALKMAGVQVLLSGMGFLGGALAHALSDDEEEKKAIEAAAEMEDKYYAALRTLLPEFQLGDVRFLRESGEDKYTYVSAQRYDPMPFNSIMSASGREDYEELGHLLHSYLFEDAPLMRPMVTLFMNAPGAASNAVRKTFSSLSAEDLKSTQEASKAIKDIGAALTPGLFKRPFKEMTDDKDITPMEAMFATAGFTVGEIDLRKTAGQAAADYLAVSNLHTEDMSKEAAATDVTGTDIDWQDDILNRARSWAVARNKIKALQTIGKSDAWIREAIKANPYASSMSKDVDSLLNGQFSVPDYYKWLENKRTMELNKAGRNLTKRTEVNDKYDKLREELKLSEAGFAAALTKEGVLD